MYTMQWQAKTICIVSWPWTSSCKCVNRKWRVLNTRNEKPFCFIPCGMWTENPNLYGWNKLFLWGLPASLWRCGKFVPWLNIKPNCNPLVFNWEHLEENSADQNLLANKDCNEFPQLEHYACFIWKQSGRYKALNT